MLNGKVLLAVVRGSHRSRAAMPSEADCERSRSGEKVFVRAEGDLIIVTI